MSKFGSALKSQSVGIGNPRAENSLKIMVDDNGDYSVLQKRKGVWVNVSEKTIAVFIGKIKTAEFNDAYASEETAIDVLFKGAKPKNMLVDKLIFKVDEAVSSYSANSIASVAHNPLCNVMKAEAQHPKLLKEDISVKVTLQNENQCDWLTGEISVFAVFAFYPKTIKLD